MVLNSNPDSKLNQIIAVAEKLENSKLDSKVLDEIDGILTPVADYLGVDKICAMFFSIIFVLENQTSNAVNLRDIAEFLDYSFIHILEFRNSLSKLEDEELISLKERKNVSPHAENNGYVIHGSVMNNIIDGTEIVKVQKEDDSEESILTELYFIQNAYEDHVFNAIEYNRQICDFEKKHSDFPLIANTLEKYKDDLESRLLIYGLAWDKVLGNQSDEEDYEARQGSHSLMSWIPKRSIYKRKKSFSDGTDILIKDGLAKLVYNRRHGNFQDQYIQKAVMTNDGIRYIFGDSAEKYIEEETDESEMDVILNSLIEFGYRYETRKRYSIKCYELRNKEKEVLKYSFFKKMHRLIKNDVERFILYDVLSDAINGAESSLTATLSDMYGKTNLYFDALRSYLDEKNFLITNDFLEIEKDKVIERTKVTPSEKTLELLYGKNADIFRKNNGDKNVIYPEKLKEKTLFYSDEVQKQIDMLEASLKEENIVQMQKRLEAKGLCKGIAVILYGAPGTGKTETVYQLAKRTNRKILHVDISESKSMWFGESEKLIKKIFTNYRNLCKSCKLHNENTPILLFNEADALISKRTDIGNSAGVGQTENAIQNILLEEMEKLDGIMIATTNLCENMDKAFERRFLFKIKYEKPTKEARENIWKSKIDFLTEKDICSLAADFDFSGGEIDNIVRKCEMNEIISGKKSSYEEVIALCKEERLARSSAAKIGF